MAAAGVSQELTPADALEVEEVYRRAVAAQGILAVYEPAEGSAAKRTATPNEEQNNEEHWCQHQQRGEWSC